MNIVFSTTRQWNPGDEFILMGCINLLAQHLGDFNPIIYNRNPQIRRARKFDIIKAIDNAAGKDFVEKFLDNSVKDRTPMDYADMVVFAGSPEWRGRRMEKLYASVLEFGLPSLFLGIGTSGKFAFTGEYFTKSEQDVFNQALLITTRDEDTQAGLQPLEAHHLPCPALFSSQNTRVVKGVKRIGLMYGTDSAVACNNVSSNTYRYMMEAYCNILRDYGDEYEIEFVSHYIDELSSFKQDFPDRTIRYSYDAKDYLAIYDRYDLVIGYRVHGIGISASMGIPGIMLAHDPRASTVKGFCAEMVNIGTEYDELKALIDDTIATIEEKSLALQAHKEATREKYLALFDRQVRLP
ncbi:polysaccharide pyruvyl transferase family protein [Halomonas sp. C05BenzN]|uniref:polysaccharide pyruvyl transferase family protein n=1 Tax=Halomonas sp. C05BenzN TaxID=3411041 RepID=UPI003B9281AE